MGEVGILERRRYQKIPQNQSRMGSYETDEVRFGHDSSSARNTISIEEIQPIQYAITEIIKDFRDSEKTTQQQQIKTNRHKIQLHLREIRKKIIKLIKLVYVPTNDNIACMIKLDSIFQIHFWL